MASKTGKLELTWVGKDQRPRLESRLLLEDPSKSYGDPKSPNLLIRGDNLLALKALEQEFGGSVKCIYVDPPYNTGQAFEHYDDGLEHSIWLGLMRDRFEVLNRLLAKDGTLFCQLNDDEMAYGKVLLDEVFGRSNFLNQVSVKMKQTAGASGGGEDKRLKKNVEYILVYARDKDGVGGFQKFNDVYDEEDLFEIVDEMEADGKSWKYTSILLERGNLVEQRTVLDGAGEPIRVKKFKGLKRTTVNALMRAGRARGDVYAENFDCIFSDTNAQTSIRTRIINEFEALAEDELLEAEYVPKSGKDKGEMVQHLYISPTIRRVIWLKDTAVKRGKRLLKLEKTGTYWEGFPLNNLTKEGGVQFPHGKKPEALIRKILELATQRGDLVLDSFGGSGTTGAVAQKMGRRWIMVEMGNHCDTHILPRLRRVIDGQDAGGVTEAVGWRGGGGFKYYELAESLLVRDGALEVFYVNPKYDADMLIRAICKVENFRYRPRGRWHGYSSETHFIHVVTQILNQAYLDMLAGDLGEHDALLVYCMKRDPGLSLPPNVKMKRIPKDLLAKCEFRPDLK